jgi:hypothetical protein
MGAVELGLTLARQVLYHLSYAASQIIHCLYMPLILVVFKIANERLGLPWSVVSSDDLGLEPCAIPSNPPLSF